MSFPYLFTGSLARGIRYIEARRIHVYIPLSSRNYSLRAQLVKHSRITLLSQFTQYSNHSGTYSAEDS